LLPELGPEHVIRVAEAFLADTLSLVNQAYWAIPILATTESVALASQYGVWVWKHSEMKRGDVQVWLQGGGNLGKRIERTLQRCIENHGGGLVVGADSPGLPYHCLANARRALLEADAVIGPTYDGGFYLLGLNQCPEGLLDDIPWSTVNTFDATLERLRAHKLNVIVLEYYWDVDYPEDWKALWDRKNRGELSAQATSSIMDSIGEDFVFNGSD